MGNNGTLIVIVAMLLTTAAEAGGVFSPRLEASAVMTFGGAKEPSYAVSMGATLVASNGLAALGESYRFPLSGMSFSVLAESKPTFFGVPIQKSIRPMADSDANGGLAWGWIAVGAAVIGGVVAVLSESSSSEDNERQDRCDETELFGTDGGDGDDPFIVGCSASR